VLRSVEERGVEGARKGRNEIEVIEKERARAVGGVKAEAKRTD